MIEIIKNPVIIGLTVGILVYIYMKWEQSKRRPYEKNKRKDSNLLIPLGIGVAAWFIAHNYFENYNFTTDGTNQVLSEKLDFTNNIPSKIEIEDTMVGGANLGNNIMANNNMTTMPQITQMRQIPQIQSYHLLKRGVTIPENINMPDVLLENF